MFEGLSKTLREFYHSKLPTVGGRSLSLSHVKDNLPSLSLLFLALAATWATVKAQEPDCSELSNKYTHAKKHDPQMLPSLFYLLVKNNCTSVTNLISGMPLTRFNEDGSCPAGSMCLGENADGSIYSVVGNTSKIAP